MPHIRVAVFAGLTAMFAVLTPAAAGDEPRIDSITTWAADLELQAGSNGVFRAQCTYEQRPCFVEFDFAKVDPDIEPAWYPELLAFDANSTIDGVLCDCPCATASGSVAGDELAHVLNDIRQHVGCNLFQGTVYQQVAANASDDPNGELPPAAFADEVRRLETSPDSELNATVFDDMLASDACEKPELVVAADSETTAATPVSRVPDRDVVLLLRQVSRQLEAAANDLEDREIYFRADQLRDLAAELRHEARSSGGAWILEPLGHVPQTSAPRAERDLARENEELRAELERLRESFRAAAPTSVR